MNWELNKDGHWILNVLIARDGGVIAEGIGEVTEYLPQSKPFRWWAQITIGDVRCNADGHATTLKRAQKIAERKLKWLADKPKGHCFDFAKDHQ